MILSSFFPIFFLVIIIQIPHRHLHLLHVVDGIPFLLVPNLYILRRNIQVGRQGVEDLWLSNQRIPVIGRLHSLIFVYFWLLLWYVYRVEFQPWIGQAAAHLSDQGQKIRPWEDDANSRVSFGLWRYFHTAGEGVTASLWHVGHGVVENIVVLPFLLSADIGYPLEFLSQHHLVVVDLHLTQPGFYPPLHLEGLIVFKIFDIWLDCQLGHPAWATAFAAFWLAGVLPLDLS